MREANVSSWAARGVYLFATVLMFWPFADLLLNAWPPQVGNVSWRYGFAGLLAGFFHTPLLGALIAMGFAFWRGEHGILRFLSVVLLIAAFFLALIMSAFPLDVIQVRATRPPEVLPAIVVGAIIAELKHLTTLLVLLLLGIGGWKTAAAMATTDKRAVAGMVASPKAKR